MTLLLATLAPTQLVRLSPIDIAIVIFYFALVLSIGWYLKGRANTGEDFFMAGREMTAWVAGLSFLSANLGALELMGWAGSAYQYGILATHWYWIGAIPAMLFLALVMMPFYYISKTHSVPGYLKLRFGESSRALSAVSFAFMTVLMSGVNMFAMAKVMQIVLGWDINFSIWVSSLTVAIYVTLGGLRSAIFNEVLQFFLIWAGALLIPILGLYEAGGWSQLKVQIAHRASEQYVHLWSTWVRSATIPWALTGSALSSDWARSFRWVTGRQIFWWCSEFCRERHAQREMAPIIGAAFKMLVPIIVILPGLLGLAVLPEKLLPESMAAVSREPQLQRRSPADAGALLRTGTAGTGSYGFDRGLHVGHGGQCERLHDSLDL
jgi:SSS family solute:Na+ symporter